MQTYIDFFKDYGRYYVSGALYTVSLSFCSVIIGGLLAVVIAQGRMSENKILSKLANFYIKVVRGTPLMVQLLLIYYGLYGIGINLGDFASGVLVLSLNSAAYIAEIIRSGIQAVGKGQMEAARSLGMTKKQAMRKIIYPQAFKNILPSLGNEFAALIKETSIVSVVGLRDLMFEANMVRGRTFMPFTPILTAAVIYYILTYLCSIGVERLEKRLKASD